MSRVELLVASFGTALSVGLAGAYINELAGIMVGFGILATIIVDEFNGLKDQ